MNTEPRQIQFGKRVTTETYYDGKLHSVEINETESVDTSGLIDAQEKMYGISTTLVHDGVLHRDLSFVFELDKSKTDVKRLHYTVTTLKDNFGRVIKKN